jgi:gliding motility-associated-like protein
MLRTQVRAKEAFIGKPALKKNLWQAIIWIFLLCCLPVTLLAQPPAVFAVTGGGNYCEGTLGMPVGLAGSETEVTYILIKDGVATGITLEGTGSALNFGNQTAGTYTIEGKNAETSVIMNGSAVIEEIKATEPPSGNSLQSFCSTSSPTVASLVAAGTLIQWYDAVTGGTLLGQTTALVDGTHYYASQTVNGCESTSRLDVTAVVNITPSAPTGSTTQNFCSVSMPTVADLVATGTMVQWYTAASDGTPLAPTTALVNGTHYYATQTVNGCESTSRLNVFAVVTTTPPAPTGNTTQTYCSTELPAVADLVSTGILVQWYSAPTGGTPLASTTALVNGAHYYASQTINSCESTVRLDVTAVVNTTPAAPAGSTTQTFCSATSPTIASLVATGTMVRWYAAATGGTPLASTTALVNGTHYYASQTVNGCESTSRLDVTVVVNTTPAAPAGSTIQTFCSSTYPTVASLVATGTSIQWFSAPSGGLPLESTDILFNDTHYYASQTVNGCESTTRLDVTVVVNLTPAAPTGSTTQTFCSATSPTVASLVATGTLVQWYAAATGGTPLASTAALVNGTHYYASQTVNGCESTTRLNVTAVVNATPLAPTGSTTQTFCSATSPTVASLVATGTLVQWYAAATGGTPLASTTALVNGTHYYASQTVNGCESTTRLNVTSVVNTTPAAPTGSTTQTFCSSTSPTVASLIATGTSIQWFSAANGGPPLASTTALVNGTHYYASQTVNGCESTSRLDVTAVVNLTPAAPTGNTTQTFCSATSPTVASLVATGTMVQWYAAATGGTPLASTTALVNGTHYYASQTVNGCESTTRLNVTAVVNATPLAPAGSTTQTFCSATSPTVASLVATGTMVQWYAAATGGTPLPSTTALVNGTHYYASQTVNGCESTTRLNVTAVVNLTPAAPTGSTTQTFCSATSPTVASLVATGTMVQWYAAATGGTPLASTTALVNGTHYYASQTVNGCESTLRLNVTAVIIITPVVTNQTVAIMTGSTFNVTPSGSGVPAGTTYTWSAPSVVPSGLTGGTAQLTPQSSISGTLYLPSGAGTATYTVTPHNGTCTGNTFTLTVFVTSSCVAAAVIAEPEDAATCVSGTASFTVGVNGTSPLVYRWQYYNGTSWVNTSNGTPSGASYTGATAATMNVSGISIAGNFQYRCNITNCTPSVTVSSAAAELTVNAPPSAPVIGFVVQPSCTVSTGTITISGPSGIGITYSINGTDYTNTTGVFSNVAAGNYTARARNSAGCISAGTAVTVNAQPATPAAPAATLIQPSCTVATGTITVTSPTGTGMTYSIDGATYVASNVFSAVASGTYTVTARSSAGCTSPGTSVTLNSQPPTPVVVVTNPDPVCSPGTVNLTASSITAGSTPDLIYTYWTNSQATIAYTTPSAAGNGTYYIKGTNSFGCYDTEPVIVSIIQTPAANPGTGGNECDLNFQLNAISGVGTGTWSMNSGPGTAVFSPSPNNPLALVTVSEYGTYTFRWTEVNGICSNSNTITVNFYEQPVANAGTGGNNCGQSFRLNGSMNVGTGVWTRVSGPTGATATFSPSASDPAATVTVSAYGSYNFRWTVTNGTCTSYASVSVNFVQQPAADAGNGGEECDLDFILNAVPGAAAGTWSKLNGPGDAVFSNPALPGSKVTVSMPGTYDFAWTIQNVACKSTDVVTVIFREIPLISAGADKVICQGSSVRLQATGEGAFVWTPGLTLSDPNVADPLATPSSETLYTVTITDSYGCMNTDDVLISVSPVPVANAGPDQVLDFVMETNLSAVPVLSGTGTWSVIAGAGNIERINDPNSGVTQLEIGFNEFRWTVDNGICPPVSDDVVVRVNDLIIPTLITPDHGDAYNEYFVIKGLQTLGKTSLIVFDRRGMRVFENSDYNNDWNGVDQNSTDLPEDTYYYVLKTSNGRSYKGFIMIRR